MNLKNILEPYTNKKDILGLMQVELESEKEGNAYSYTLPTPVDPINAVHFYRSSPVLLHFNNETQPSHALVFTTGFNEMVEKLFYDFR